MEEFHVGQKVIALRTLGEGPDEDGPYSVCADCGDELIVRGVRPASDMKYHIRVSHEGVTDRSFWCAATEIEAAPPTSEEA